MKNSVTIRGKVVEFNKRTVPTVGFDSEVLVSMGFRSTKAAQSVLRVGTRAVGVLATRRTSLHAVSRGVGSPHAV